MARYWIYLNGQVGGPYEIEDLIRLRGFSRRTLVCVDDASGTPTQWTSPDTIPELRPIFKIVDQVYEPSLKEPAAKAPSKPLRPRMPLRLTPVSPPPPERNMAGWSWLLIFALIGGAVYWIWSQLDQKKVLEEEEQLVQTLIGTYPLPASSVYGTLRQYWEEKHVTPRWELERMPSGVYRTTLSWSATPGARLSLYAFDVNLQAQSVRAVNSAAEQLINEGIRLPAAETPGASKNPPKRAPPKAESTPDSIFPSVIKERGKALDEANYEIVWKMFSTRKRLDMQKAGMSQSGFVRLQSLTHKVDAPVRQSVLKTKKESDEQMLVLLRQTQEGHSDLFLKQTWVWENDSWKLDDEEKRAAESDSAPSTPPVKSHPAVESLPGIAPKP